MDALPRHSDPFFVPASDWLARGAGEARPVVLVLGAPYGGASISRARCDRAPSAIRAALGRFSTYSSDEGVSLEGLAAIDAGDASVPFGGVEEAIAAITRAVEEACVDGALPLVLLGGDNSVTVAGVRGARANALITFDAHHDVREYAAGRTNGSVVRELIDEGLSPFRVTQIGIHGFANAEQYANWARDAGISFLTARVVRQRGIEVIVGEALSRVEGGRIWVDFDLDVLDRASAPGAPGSLPGGLSAADLEQAAFLVGRNPSVVGCDVVEFDPEQDVGDITARAACAVMLAFCAGVAARG